MGAAAIRIEDAKQQVRIRRFLLAAAAYAVSAPLLVLAHWLGLIAFVPMVTTVAAIALSNLGLYALFRTGLNERFKDPSLTWLQTLSAIAILMFVVYHFDHERGLALMMCLVVLAFGTFRFTPREFLTASGVVLAAYAAVINLIMWRKPEVVNVPLEA